ncbi:MAG: hypothetical protein JF587_02880 [Catenulisporales bacterium]|nr:hypothetical protein [Catenulisporales bacterium]
MADRLSAVLSELAPDLLRWHLPRRGHGAGELAAGLLVPLAEFVDGGVALTLVAMTPRVALDAGQRVVLTVLDSGARARRFVDDDPVKRALLGGVRVKHAGRHSLVRFPMFWNASRAPELAGMRAAALESQEITFLQDTGRFAEAWLAAGFGLDVDSATATPSRLRWLTALPVCLPGLAARVRSALPGADTAVVRSGGGAVVLSGLDGDRPVARVVPSRDAQGLPMVSTAAWARSVDVDLLRFGLLGAHELHPLVASALMSDPPPAVPEPDEWLYREVPYIAGPCADADVPTVCIRCGPTIHRVAHRDGTWRPIDHQGHAERESFLKRLGGPANPCLQAAEYLASGRHVIDLVESLLRHGRADDVQRVLHLHAGAEAVLHDVALPTGGTVGEALATLRENTLQFRMLLAGATRPRDTASYRSTTRRRTRKGDPARTHR